MSKIKKWLAPPHFEDEKQARTARYTHYLLLSTSFLISLLLVFQIAFGFNSLQDRSTYILSGLLFLFLGSEIALRRGYVTQASYIFVVSGWTGLTFLSFTGSGIHGSSYIAYIIIILLTGLLLGWRMSIVFAILSILSGWAMAYVEATNLVTFETNIGYDVALDTTFIYALVAIILSITIGSLENAVKSATVSEESLADANEELRKAQEGLESRVAQQTRDLTLAAEIGRDISQVRDIDSLLTSSIERIRSRFDLYYAQIFLVDKEGTHLNLSAGTGGAGEAILAKGLRLNIDARSINGQAALEKKPVIVPDTSLSPLFRPNSSLPYTRSELAIPLLVGDDVLGVLDLQSTTVGALNEENLYAFEILAGQLAIALQNASLFREQERLAEELRENTQQFEENANFLDTIIENLPNMIFVKDAKDLRYVRWNKAGSELVGIPAENFVGKTDYEFFPEHEADFFIQKDREVLNNGVVVDIPEETIETADKGQRLLHTIKVPILDSDGNPQFLLGISQDITEQKNAERLLNDRVKELNLLNEIGRKTDEQLSLEDFLNFIADRIPEGMQHSDLCKVAITMDDTIYGDPDAIELPTQIVEGLRLDGDLVGRIYIAYTEKRIFLNEESALIGSVGRRITDYIVSRRLLERVQATVEGLQTVAEVGTAITTQQDTQHLLQTVVDQTKNKFDFYHAHIYLYDELSQMLMLSAGAGEVGQKMVNEKRQIPLAAPRSLVARSARERRSLVVDDVKADPGFLSHPLLPETRSEMAVPLVVGDRLIGVMDIQSATKNGFSAEDINIQSTLASQIAVALQNAEQYEQTQAALDELNALQRARTREGWQGYMTAVNRATQGFQTTQNKIMPINQEDLTLTNGDSKETTIAYPISVQGTAIGKLGINTDEKDLSDEELSLLKSISDQVAEALERARLFEETEVARSQTEALFDGSRKVVSSTTMDDILQALVEATALQKMERVSILFFNRPWQETPPESFTLNSIWLHEKSEGLLKVGTTFPMTDYATAYFLDRDSLILVPDLASDPRLDEATRHLFLDQLGTHTAITIPLVAGDIWIGFVLGLSSTEFHMTQSEQRQISSLVGQAATVAQSQRLYQEAQSRAQREQILREVTARVTAAVDAESVLQTATREIGRALGLETFVYIKNPKPTTE